MAENELDAFLGAGSEPAPEPQQAPPPEPAEPEPPDEDEGDAAEPDEGDAPAPPPNPKDGRTVPLSALEKVREDWKAKAVRAETERDELRRQLEEAKRVAQQPPQQPQYQQPINPAEDPAGYHALIQQTMLNERLNMSEAQLRREIGSEAVDAAINEFKQAAAKNPSLMQQLYQQPDPYAWVAKQVEVLRIQREIGDDPAAYRAKLRAELEAELAARGDAPMPPVSPAARLAPSLANARSAAPRSNGAWAGPTPLEDILRR
jgi:hypothetical protein